MAENTHLVHTLPSVPMQEGFASEHGCELIRDTLEDLLDGGVVSDEGDGHLEASGWNITLSELDVVGDPLCNIRIECQ